ncbi:hypothetical protein AB0L86_24980 [Micromonospora musae]|uniref:hypothetical protein n=1 Tax=Micromonospora musae TaxID=1894970 RepID=UPI00343027DC
MNQSRSLRRLPALFALLIVVVAGPAGCAGRQAAAADGPAPSLAVGDSCPDSYRPLDRKPAPTSAEPLVPTTISAATLCIYDTQSRKLNGWKPLPAGREEALARHLNELDTWQRTANEADGCLLGDDAAHQILLRQESGINILVLVECGVAARDGVVRRLDSVNSVLGFWLPA